MASTAAARSRPTRERTNKPSPRLGRLIGSALRHRVPALAEHAFELGEISLGERCVAAQEIADLGAEAGDINRAGTVNHRDLGGVAQLVLEDQGRVVGCRSTGGLSGCPVASVSLSGNMPGAPIAAVSLPCYAATTMRYGGWHGHPTDDGWPPGHVTARPGSGTSSAAVSLPCYAATTMVECGGWRGHLTIDGWPPGRTIGPPGSGTPRAAVSLPCYVATTMRFGAWHGHPTDDD
jgi:hypothetical protein